ncbi:MAG: hypothetical protein IJL67_11235 [Oscillospiraceae bacterium]|nr:hypothetical protein [Oscillospiraceae bacterium]
MNILFCNIAWMKFYNGNPNGTDQPHGGGEYVERTGDAHEKFNFTPTKVKFNEIDPAEEYCVGFVETKSTNGAESNQLNIEKITGNKKDKAVNVVDDVLVIYCALYPFSSTNETYIVGWYNNAEVYRKYQKLEFTDDNGEIVYEQYYNAISKIENCVLLPESARRNQMWRVPRKRKGMSFGFGQANVWFAQGADENPKLQEFLDRIVKQIEEYDGENMVVNNKNT